jgi:hypothetical protein
MTKKGEAAEPVKIPKDGVGYMVDIYELTSAQMKSTMRPFVSEVFHGQEILLREIKKRHKFEETVIIHDTWIKALGLIDIILLFGIILHWVVSAAN